METKHAIDLHPGDVFGANLGGVLGNIIKCAEAIKSADGEARYSHTGIILTPQGKTFEALWTIKSQNFFEAYRGAEVIVARYNKMNNQRFRWGYDAIHCQAGQTYPVLRLVLHLLNAAKIHLPNRMVCSELTSCFLINAGAPVLSGKNSYGVSPDNLVDEWRISRHFDIIFEGKL